MARRLIRRILYAGVPQGSILGSLLWNLLCDGLLKVLKSMPHLNGVAFVGDLAVILDVPKQEGATTKLSDAMDVISRWCADCGLRIAREKTQVIFLTGKWISKIIEMNAE